MGGSAEIHPESSDQETQAEPMMSWSKAYAHLEKYKITPRLVFEACPSLIELDERGMTADTANWDDLHALANQSRSVMGISPKAWNTLIEVLGPVPATVAMAVLTEKGARSVAGTAPRPRRRVATGSASAPTRRVGRPRGRCSRGYGRRRLGGSGS